MTQRPPSRGTWCVPLLHDCMCGWADVLVNEALVRDVAMVLVG